MRLQAQRKVPVVLDHMLPERHRRELRLRLQIDEADRPQQGQVVLVAGAVEPAHDPQRLAPVEAERAEGIRLGELLEDGRRDLGAQPDVAHRIVAGAPPLDEPAHVDLADAFHLPEAQPDGMVADDVAARAAWRGWTRGRAVSLVAAISTHASPMSDGEGHR